MEKISSRSYKGFVTEFYVTKKVQDFLSLNNVDYSEFLPDNYHWYEVELFEMIDKDKKDTTRGKFQKRFRVVYYGIIEKWKNKEETEGFEDKFKYENKKLISDWTKVVSEKFNIHKSFAVKYKILIE